MLRRLRNWWQRATTMPCKGCGELVPVADYREIGTAQRAGWWVGDSVELECPHCGDSFWVKK